jgi:MarR family transcriptional regulator, organic hydroperoxide resistance regulator
LIRYLQIFSILLNMTNRKQKIEELMENFQALKRTMVFHTVHSIKVPRITPSQWGVLMLVEQHIGITVKDVAKMLSITSSATTQLIDGLVANGYIMRKTSVKDRRTVILTLSNKTKTQVEKMKKEGLQKFLKLFEGLNDKEFNQYILLNKKIVEKLLKK